MKLDLELLHGAIDLKSGAKLEVITSNRFHYKLTEETNFCNYNFLKLQTTNTDQNTLKYFTKFSCVQPYQSVIKKWKN